MHPNLPHLPTNPLQYIIKNLPKGQGGLPSWGIFWKSLDKDWRTTSNNTYLFVICCVMYFIFLTNIEKLTYFLIHFLDIFKFLKYFFENFTHFKKFNVFFWNFTYFSEISCIYKYVKSCICPLGLHYEIRECAYLSPRGIASKFKNAIKNIFTKFFLIQSCKKLV